MNSMWSESVRWNIFARELEDILSAHGLRLGHLDDRGVIYHPEKVRRLQQSLDAPTHFPVLNPEELERLVAVVGLTEHEQTRIRAALVATAVERTLMDRLDPQTALMAASDVFEICLAAMRERPTLAAAVKSGTIDENAPMDGGEREDAHGRARHDALRLIEAATLDLHASRGANTRAARLRSAREARAGFVRALMLLQRVEAMEMRASDGEATQSWAAEAREGQFAAEAVIEANRPIDGAWQVGEMGEVEETGEIEEMEGEA